MKLQIAGLKLSIVSGHWKDKTLEKEYMNAFQEGFFAEYLCDFRGEPDVEIVVEEIEETLFIISDKVIDYGFYTAYIFSDHVVLEFAVPCEGNTVYMYYLEVTNHWRNAVLKVYRPREPRVLSIACPLRILFEACIIKRNSFVLHSSTVEWNEKAIAFSAPSGGGKTTQSSFWLAFGASIINGDTIALGRENGVTWVSGIPWCGSSCQSVCKSLPLDTIVIIKKGGVDSIRLLDQKESFWAVFPHIRRPLWDEGLADETVRLLGEMLAGVTVIEFTCRPVIEAAEHLKDFVEQNSPHYSDL